MAKFELNDDSVVVIIGSGAGGGTLGNELAQKGVKVVILRSGKAKVFCAGANIRMLSKGNGSAMVNSKFNGRQLTCGCTGIPASSSLADSLSR